ncbi:MAG: VCBS repeat-containing protein [Pyrinomonadaceae bacterium]
MNTQVTPSRPINVLGNGPSQSKRETLTAALKHWRQKMGYFSMLTALPAISAAHAQEVRAEETQAPAIPISVSGQPAKRVTGLNLSFSKPEFPRRQNNYLLPHQKNSSNIVSAMTGGDNCPGVAIPNGTYTAAAPFTDIGDTTGGNNTVTSLPYYYYDDFGVNGPDHIYAFTLTSRGAAPEIRVTTSSPTYNPAIYVVNGEWGPCPAGAPFYWFAYSNVAGAGGTETIGDAIRYLPLNVPQWLFIDSHGALTPDPGGPYTVRMQDLTIAQGPRTKFDFDGDGRSDLSVFRQSDRTWYLDRSSEGYSAAQFGLSTDKIVPADFDGDGKTDLAVFRDGIWYWVNSSNGTIGIVQFGLAADIPVPADFSGDGQAELAIFRNGFWWSLNLASNQINVVQFGSANDRPIAADYDGDGKTDQAIIRNQGEWHLNRSLLGYEVVHFGVAGDRPVPADYYGDGATDVAYYRDGVWVIRVDESRYEEIRWGLPTDIPVPADYDGNGYADLAVYRDGFWHLNFPTTGRIEARQFGSANDKPVPATYLP